MKCERCNNDKIWIGDMMTGRLACEHCLNDDECAKYYDEYMEAQLGQAHVYVDPDQPGTDMTIMDYYMQEKAKERTASYLTCNKACTMHDGSDWCTCLGEPSCMVARYDRNLQLELYVKAMQQEDTDKLGDFWNTYFRTEIKGEFKC